MGQLGRRGARGEGADVPARRPRVSDPVRLFQIQRALGDGAVGVESAARRVAGSGDSLSISRLGGARCGGKHRVPAGRCERGLRAWQRDFKGLAGSGLCRSDRCGESGRRPPVAVERREGGNAGRPAAICRGLGEPRVPPAAGRRSAAEIRGFNFHRGHRA